MKTLVIVTHPRLYEGSHANRQLVEALKQQSEVTVHDLYGTYENWSIDTRREQQLLLDHDRIVLQFPLFWYSCPPLLKKWFDDVMEYGWAFGPNGTKLKGKQFILAITTGGSADDYRSGGYNWFTISEYMKPIQATVTRCNAEFLPSMVFYSAHSLSNEQLQDEAERYIRYITDEQLANYPL